MAIASVTSVLTSPANAQQILKRCAGVDVRSVHSEAEFNLDPKTPLDPRLTIETASPEAAGQVVTVIARGPVLGSLDRPRKTESSCTANGLLLTTIIIRSAKSSSGTKSQGTFFYRSKIEVEMLPHCEIVVQIIWRMQLDTGPELHHAQISPTQTRHIRLR
jgi:hypothetical protein